ncbi:hypothetical protein [Cytobacillus oceanisediminis]|uniref:hypothetical protein n=1 Tax=Cytobacillus oceanisediminis TaxID=665099 RepID=UPI001C24CF33|nr:hypothetical protein [Cytobacillus oceanisediminis]MBU8769877.1 hypothetical protein [Cytobacillus oceanisediminis]
MRLPPNRGLIRTGAEDIRENESKPEIYPVKVSENLIKKLLNLPLRWKQVREVKIYSHIYELKTAIFMKTEKKN